MNRVFFLLNINFIACSLLYRFKAQYNTLDDKQQKKRWI